MPSGSREEVSSHSPCPFWAKPITHGGLFHLTTIQKCVRVPTHAQLCSAGFAGGFSVTAFHARFIALKVSRGHGACASPWHLGERNCTSTAPKLSQTLRSRPFIPDGYRHFEGTDRSFPLYAACPRAEYYGHADATPGPRRIQGVLPRLYCRAPSPPWHSLPYAPRWTLTRCWRWRLPLIPPPYWRSRPHTG
jgi:hypothetical protein